MAVSEATCQAKGLQLYLLPPKSPEMNGGVERANASWRYAFYGCYDLPHRLDDLNQLIDSFAHLDNHQRPHGALQGQTPAAYIARLTANETHASQTP